jgi:hypothetical protein
MGANGLLGDPLPVGDLTLQLRRCSDGKRGSESGTVDGDRGSPLARGEGDGEEKHELGGLEEEVLMVAEWPREGGVNRPLQSSGAEAEDGAMLRLGKTTKV